MKKTLNNRREFIKNSLKAAFGLSPIAASVLYANESNKDEKQPNVLIIYTDQQALWTISAYKGMTAQPTDINTPHIDSIAKEGALLKNYFANSAVCTPSRGCFVSGLYPHRNGAYANDKPLRRKLLPDGTWGDVFYQNGYDTGWIGKWHLDGSKKPGPSKKKRFLGFGQQQWRWNRGHWKGIESKGSGMETRIKKYSKKMHSDKQYTTNWLGDRTVDFINHESKRNNKNPFVFTVSFPDPHGPHEIYDKYSGMYIDKTLPPKSVSTDYDTQRPDWANMNHDAEHIKPLKEQYLAMVKCIDDNVGKILNALDENRLTENTIVIFTTDHGDFMGEHGLTGKNLMYEPAFHIPFLIKWPNHIPKGVTIDEFITTVDIKDTLLGLTGIPYNPAHSDGKDASKIIMRKESGERWENIAYLHHEYFDRTGIVTDEWFLAHTKGQDSVLYNRITDQEQINNLVKDPRYADVVAELTLLLYKHHLKYKTKKVTSWLKNYLV